MNIIRLSLLGILIFSLTSCSQDEASAEKITGTLEGVWNLTELEYVGYTESKIDGMFIRTDYEGFAENIKATTTFYDNGTFESQGVYDVILTGEGMTIPYRNLSYTSKGDYTLSGRKMEITNFEGQSNPGAIVASTEKDMTIVELTSSKLVLDFTEDILIKEGDDEAFISNTGQYIFTR